MRAATTLRRLVPGLLAIALAAGVLLLLDRPRGSGERRNPPQAGLREPAAAPADPGGVAAGSEWRPARLLRIDLLEYVNLPDVEDAEVGIRTGFAEAGLAAGRDFELRVRNAQGNMWVG